MSLPIQKHQHFPSWLKIRISADGKFSYVASLINENRLNTVCDNAKCPNRNECYNRGTATVLILGNICTRKCGFCAISTGQPLQPDLNEPERVLKLAQSLKLRYVVVTSVTRDDLEDGGAYIFANTIRLLKKSGFLVEVLVPDFLGKKESVIKVVDAHPDVFNHNLETVKRLQKIVRPQADYHRSLKVLEIASSYARDNKLNYLVKSGIMVGLGETDEEIFEAINDLFSVGCSVITIGQYLQPSSSNLPVARFVEPSSFKKYEEFAKSIGFKDAFCGPFVRSSYMAESLFLKNI